ncbi:hypothetical protein [Taklimakanibacter deserti]|uniref:hypothetical protein n=1 Tax=Taklimakanibacter deserti TaxID=2267839 RepID=UPI0013C4256B
MVLDRRDRHGLVQALLRAHNRKYGDNSLDNVAQTGMASGDESYSEPAFGGTRFPFASQLGMTTSEEAASQSRELIPTPRPYPFREPTRSSYPGEVADRVKARGIPAHNQPAFTEAPGTSSRPANPQTIYNRPFAVKTASVLPWRYLDYLWERSPSYCPPMDDNLTFPPLIYQDKAPLTEADKDHCHDQFFHDNEQCHKNYGYSPEAWRKCHERALEIRDLCLRGEKETRPWSDPDEDGIFLPKPPNRRKKKR